MKDSLKKAQAKYDAKNAKYISLKLNKTTDAELIAKLESVPNIQGYLKALIMADIKDRGE